MAPASEIIYDALRELATRSAGYVQHRRRISSTNLPPRHEIFKIILTARPQHTIPTALWSSSYFLFFQPL